MEEDKKNQIIKVGLGQDSHRFGLSDKSGKLILGGVVFEGDAPLLGNSDADVVLHSVTNAISGITGINIMGKVADEMCQKGITDSAEYLKEALRHLGNIRIIHVSISIECQTPEITPRIAEMRERISSLLNIGSDNVGITATTGEDLTAFGKGEGIQALSVVTARQEIS